MSPQEGTFGSLIIQTREQLEETVDVFCERLKIDRSTYYRWIGGAVLLDDMKLRQLGTIAELAGISVEQLFRQYGKRYIRPSSPRLDLDIQKLHLYPLVKEIRDDEFQKKSILGGIKAREGYFGSDQPSEQRENFRQVAEYARFAHEPYLATYYKIYHCNLLWMTGELVQADKLFGETYDAAEKIRDDGIRSQDRAIEWLGKRLMCHAKLRNLWAKYWAGGVSEQSIIQGNEMIKDLIECQFYQRIPYVYEFLARCALALGRPNEAIKYVENAEKEVKKLRNQWYTRFELFLDAGANPERGIDYNRQEDHFRETKLDVLIAAHRYVEAFAVYRKIKTRRPLEAYLSLHYWFDAGWQAFLNQQVMITPVHDPKIGTTFDDWQYNIDRNGNLRVQAMLTLSQGETDFASGNLWDARLRFNQAEDLARQCGATDLVAISAAHTIWVAIKEQKWGLAISKEKVIESIYHTLANAHVHKQVDDAREALRQMRSYD